MLARLPVAAVLWTLLGTPMASAEELPGVARRLADGLAQALAASPDRAEVRTVAVLPFSAGAGVGAQVGQQATEAFRQRFGAAARVAVLDGPALQGLLGEQRLRLLVGGAGLDEAEATRAGTQALVTGSLSAEGDRLRLQVKLSRLPSGRAVATAQALADPPARGAPPASAATGDTGRIDVAMRRLADGLAAGFARLPGSSRYHRLAVLPLGEVGERAQRQKLGTIVAAELATDLRRDHGLLLVERERLGQVLGELRLQQMISPDAGQAARIGQLADAQALLVGTVAEAGDRYLVTARIVAAQTGEALAAESESVQAAGMVALASDAVVLRSRGDAALRSLVVPGLGQAYNRQPVKGAAFAVAAAGLLAGGLYAHFSGAGSYQSYKRAPTQAEAARLFDDAQTSYRTRNWLLAGTAAVWALNVLDAYVSGVDGAAALSGGLAAAPAPFPSGAALVLAGRW